MECPTCSEELTVGDKQSGPEHPEVGWEYYVCPSCTDVIHPVRVETSTNNASNTESRTPSRVTFTGTVVQSSTPPLLDDGNASIELHDFFEDVQLGQEITVTGIKSAPSKTYTGKADYVFEDCEIEVSQ